MALALTRFEAVTRPIQGPSLKRGQQEVRLTVTGANTDTVWDFSAITAGALGTFWTAAVANATYGDIATSALAAFRLIQAQATAILKISGEDIVSRAQIATVAAAGQYSVAVTGHVPDITWRTGDAPTASVIHLTFQLADGVFPFHFQYG